MKIVAKINRENQSLVGDLNGRGINAKLVKGGAIIDLPISLEGLLSDNVFYEVPAELINKDAIFFIDVIEHGGAATNTGSGTIVCGLSGKALRPYYVPRGGHLSNGTHAYFSVPAACITITGYRHIDAVTIEEHRIVKTDNGVRIESLERWSGALEELPDTFIRFQAAAKAAVEKGNCYHCRCVHFAEAK